MDMWMNGQSPRLVSNDINMFNGQAYGVHCWLNPGFVIYFLCETGPLNKC